MWHTADAMENANKRTMRCEAGDERSAPDSPFEGKIRRGL